MLKWLTSLVMIFLGICLLSVGLYIGETDDSPGAPALGLFLLICCVKAGVEAYRYFKRRS